MYKKLIYIVYPTQKNNTTRSHEWKLYNQNRRNSLCIFRRNSLLGKQSWDPVLFFRIVKWQHNSLPVVPNLITGCLSTIFPSSIPQSSDLGPLFILRIYAPGSPLGYHQWSGSEKFLPNLYASKQVREKKKFLKLFSM